MDRDQGNQLNVAIVDDDPSFSRAIGRLLRAAGFEPAIYCSAEAFLEGEAHSAADCLLLDIHLPGMSGLDLCRRLKVLRNATPVIFVTAHDEPKTRAEARRAGSESYLCKPVTGKLLLDTIARVLDRTASASRIYDL